VYSKPGTLPAERPTTPNSVGPMLFTPGATEWQMLHCALKICWPAAGSAAVAASPEVQDGFLASSRGRSRFNSPAATAKLLSKPTAPFFTRRIVVLPDLS